MDRRQEKEEEIDEMDGRVTTFKGRLKLQDFIHQAEMEPVLRRSPRILSTGPATTSPVRTSSASSTPKRKSTSPVKNDIDDQKVEGKKAKRARTSSSYAPPSKYANLPLLPDAVAPNLLVFFIGLNPGIQTARSGHAYAHPSNLFWKLLFSSGVTPRLCRPEEDRQMPALYSLGLTNIVSRPSRNGAELSRQEMDDGVAALEEKARRWRPEVMCVVGKSIWESIWRVRHGGRAVGADFRYGWQDETENMGVIAPGEGESGDDEKGWPGAKVFVASSTSGLAATLKPAQKQQIWNELGEWVKARRAQRALTKSETQVKE